MTRLRALRMAMGLTQYEIADLLECSQTSISFAERNVGCEAIAKKEEEFLYSCVNVLSDVEKYDIDCIMSWLIEWDDNKAKYKARIMNYDE